MEEVSFETIVKDRGRKDREEQLSVEGVRMSVGNWFQRKDAATVTDSRQFDFLSTSRLPSAIC